MKRVLSVFAISTAVVTAVAFAPIASANSFAVSVGVPGLAVGVSNHGGYVAAYPAYPTYPAAVVYPPAPVVVAPPYYSPYYGPYYGSVVVYQGYHPYAHHYAYRHW
jgi:hypothetical protein